MSRVPLIALAAVIAGGVVGWLVLAPRGDKAGAAGPPAASHSPFRFTDVTRESGISFVHEAGRTGRHLYPEILGAGLAVFDFDNDGDLDVFLVNGNRLPPAAPDAAVRSVLYRNEGGGRFTDVTDKAGLDAVGYGQGACFGDVDGDGHRDLYVTYYGSPNRLFRNRGDGTFVSREKEAGLAHREWGQTCAFLDYDGDGNLDLYSLNYLTYSVDMPQTRDVLLGGTKVEDYLGPQPFKGAVSRLYRNRGDGTFTDVTREAGLHLEGKGMGVAAVDFDGDFRTDVFQANDSTPDFLFKNLANGRFEEVGLTAGVAVSGDGNPRSSMGVDVGDYDNDGDLDLAVPVVRQEVYGLYRNDAGLFTDVSWPTGLAEATGRLTGFSAHFGDFDNDADLDLYFTNGEVHIHELAEAGWDETARYGTRDSLLANDGAGRFTDASRGAGDYFDRALISRGAAVGDLDGDGDLDIVVSNAGGPAVVLRNDTRGGHWLRVVLRGHGKNHEAIGAKAWLEAGGRKQYRELHGGGGYVSANDRRLHFGLGAATKVDALEIRWPDGHRQTLRDVAVDRELVIERDAAR